MEDDIQEPAKIRHPAAVEPASVPPLKPDDRPLHKRDRSYRWRTVAYQALPLKTKPVLAPDTLVVTIPPEMALELIRQIVQGETTGSIKLEFVGKFTDDHRIK